MAAYHGPSCFNFANWQFFSFQPTESDDTKIHTSINNDLSVNLYRIVKTAAGKQRLYLDLNPQASTVDYNSSSVTSKFEVRGGKITC